MTTSKFRPAKLRKLRRLSAHSAAAAMKVSRRKGIYEIDDAKCKIGTVDIKLDNDYTVILISRY